MLRVISLHGIRTRGPWQKELAPILAEEGFIPHPLDYGFFRAVTLLVPPVMNKRVEWLRKEYERIVSRDPQCRPSIIAHSFGSWLVANLISKYPQVKFDKVILTGSIVDRDYDWLIPLGRGQLNYLRNDYGKKDIWPKIASRFVQRGGASGTLGFEAKGPLIVQKEFVEYSHSTCFTELHFINEWLPTLKQLILHVPGKQLSLSFDEKGQKSILELLNLAVQTASRKLNVDSGRLRTNVFVESEPDILRIPQGMHYNMNSKRELTAAISTGQGCTGQSYRTKKRAWAFLAPDWGEHSLPDDQLDLVHRELRWVVSTPIPMLLNGTTEVMGIFNLDCLREMKTRQDLRILEEQDDLLTTAQALGQIFSKGVIQWNKTPAG